MKTEAEIYGMIEDRLREPLEELWCELTPEERGIAHRLLPEIVESIF